MKKLLFFGTTFMLMIILSATINVTHACIGEEGMFCDTDENGNQPRIMDDEPNNEDTLIIAPNANENEHRFGLFGEGNELMTRFRNGLQTMFARAVENSNVEQIVAKLTYRFRIEFGENNNQGNNNSCDGNGPQMHCLNA